MPLKQTAASSPALNPSQRLMQDFVDQYVTAWGDVNKQNHVIERVKASELTAEQKAECERHCVTAAADEQAAYMANYMAKLNADIAKGKNWCCRNTGDFELNCIRLRDWKSADADEKIDCLLGNHEFLEYKVNLDGGWDSHILIQWLKVLKQTASSEKFDELIILLFKHNIGSNIDATRKDFLNLFLDRPQLLIQIVNGSATWAIRAKALAQIFSSLKEGHANGLVTNDQIIQFLMQKIRVSDVLKLGNIIDVYVITNSLSNQYRHENSTVNNLIKVMHDWMDASIFVSLLLSLLEKNADPQVVFNMLTIDKGILLRLFAKNQSALANELLLQLLIKLCAKGVNKNEVRILLGFKEEHDASYVQALLGRFTHEKQFKQFAGIVYQLLNHNLLPQEDFEAIKRSKSSNWPYTNYKRLRDVILSLPNDERTAAIQDALNPEHPVGKLFHESQTLRQIATPSGSNTVASIWRTLRSAAVAAASSSVLDRDNSSEILSSTVNLPPNPPSYAEVMAGRQRWSAFPPSYDSLPKDPVLGSDLPPGVERPSI
jgi:hypothetical protein